MRGRPNMTDALPPITDTTTLPRELVSFCFDKHTKIIAVLARPGPERFALATAVLRAMRSPGVVVATRDGAADYRAFFEAEGEHLPAAWTVLEGGNSEGGIRAVARALTRSRELIADPELEESLSALWLPSHIVEAFGLLPADGTGLVVLDSWDGLIHEYLPERSRAADGFPSAEKLEKILVNTLRKYAQALVVVIVDSSSHSRIAELADGTIEVVARGQFGTLSGSVLVSRKDGDVPHRDSLRFHLESGTLHWQSNR